MRFCFCEFFEIYFDLGIIEACVIFIPCNRGNVQPCYLTAQPSALGSPGLRLSVWQIVCLPSNFVMHGHLSELNKSCLLKFLLSHETPPMLTTRYCQRWLKVLFQRLHSTYQPRKQPTTFTMNSTSNEPTRNQFHFYRPRALSYDPP